MTGTYRDSTISAARSGGGDPRRSADRGPSRGALALRWLILAVLAVYAVSYLWFAAQLVTFRFEMDQGEGYDVWSAWLIAQGQLPYTDNASYPYFSSNYPPLWSALVALPMRGLGPSLVPGRVISVASALLATIVVGLAAAGVTHSPLPSSRRVAPASWGGQRAHFPLANEGWGAGYQRRDWSLAGHSRRATPSLLAGFFGAGLFLASPYVFHTTALARVNSLALLLALAALALVETPTRSRVALGMLALLASLFAKPTAVDAAAACVGFLFLVRPSAAVWMLTRLLGLGALGLALLLIATRGAFWLNAVQGNINSFDLSELGKYAVNFCGIHAVVLILAGSEALRAVRARAWSPWALYFPLAAVGALSVGKWGAGESYLLALIAATSVLAGARLARELVAGPPPMWLRVGILVQMLVFAHGPVSDVVPGLADLGRQAAVLGHAPTAQDRANGDALVDALSAVDGPVLSEAPSFAIAAGKPVVANATHLHNLYEEGRWNPGPLVANVRGHRFDVVVLDAQLYPGPVLAAIGRSYYLVRTVTVGPATYTIFLPGGD